MFWLWKGAPWHLHPGLQSHGHQEERVEVSSQGGFGRAHPRKGGDGPEDPLRSRRVHVAESADQSLKGARPLAESQEGEQVCRCAS